jgi:hypothetical protein
MANDPLRDIIYIYISNIILLPPHPIYSTPPTPTPRAGGRGGEGRVGHVGLANASTCKGPTGFQLIYASFARGTPEEFIGFGTFTFILQGVPLRNSSDFHGFTII